MALEMCSVKDGVDVSVSSEGPIEEKVHLIYRIVVGEDAHVQDV